MGWERRGDRLYYYRKERVGGRVVSECMGAEGSVLATVASEIDRISRERREIVRSLAAARAEVLDAEDAEVREWHDQAKAIVGAALEAAGYHRHDRGAWRKRRMSTNASNPAELAATNAGPPAVPARPGILDHNAERLWLGRFFPDPAARAPIARELGRLRAELAGPDPPPLERLLVDNVVLCWLQLQGFEAACARDGQTAESMARMERRRDQAHRRYLQATKTLAQVRRGRFPALQVNVALDGGRQVNAAGDVRH